MRFFAFFSRHGYVERAFFEAWLRREEFFSDMPTQRKGLFLALWICNKKAH